MIIIADSGSTKTDWCIIEPGGVKTFFQTSGLNPVIMGEDEFLCKLLTEQSTSLSFQHLFGLIAPLGKNTMERQNFIIDNLVVEEDLVEEI